MHRSPGLVDSELPADEMAPDFVDCQHSDYRNASLILVISHAQSPKDQAARWLPPPHLDSILVLPPQPAEPDAPRKRLIPHRFPVLHLFCILSLWQPSRHAVSRAAERDRSEGGRGHPGVTQRRGGRGATCARSRHARPTGPSGTATEDIPPCRAVVSWACALYARRGGRGQEGGPAAGSGSG